MWLELVTTLAGVLSLGLGLGLHVHRTGKRAPRFPVHAATAVVLGAKVHPDGTPSPALVDRVHVAVGLLREGRARRLLLSGRTPEAQTMARIARELGATEEQLALEAESRSTFENAALSAAWLKERQENEILLVSCDFHLARATAHFRRRGLTVWPVPSVRSLRKRDRLRVTVKEVIALLRRPWLLAVKNGN
jgi:uncharacterized SAM-binding protein YcdF (DUF218 family)